MIISGIYENQNLLLLQFVSFLVGLRTYQHSCIMHNAGAHMFSSWRACGRHEYINTLYQDSTKKTEQKREGRGGDAQKISYRWARVQGM